MKLTRRQFGQGLAASGAAALTSHVAAPALAQNQKLRIGILAPKAGAAATIGECGLRGVQWGADRINKNGGIAGRQIELVIEEEFEPKRHDRALPPPGFARKSGLHSRHCLHRRFARRGACGGRRAGALDTLGWYDPGRRQGNDAQSKFCLPKYR